MSKNVVFGKDNSFSLHTNDNKISLFLVKDGLDDTAIITEAKYFVNITMSKKKNSLSLHYNAMRPRVFYANGGKLHQFKAKDSEIKLYTLCLGNVSEKLCSR